MPPRVHAIRLTIQVRIYDRNALIGLDIGHRDTFGLSILLISRILSGQHSLENGGYSSASKVWYHLIQLLRVSLTLQPGSALYH